MKDSEMAQPHIRDVQSALWHCKEKLRVAAQYLDQMPTMTEAAELLRIVDDLSDLNGRLQNIDERLVLKNRETPEPQS